MQGSSGFSIKYVTNLNVVSQKQTYVSAYIQTIDEGDGQIRD